MVCESKNLEKFDETGVPFFVPDESNRDNLADKSEVNRSDNRTGTTDESDHDN